MGCGRFVYAPVGSVVLAAAMWTGVHAQAPTISISNTSVIEGNALSGPIATLTVSLSAPSTLPVSVDYAASMDKQRSEPLAYFFDNSAAILIKDNAPATPYPSTITVAPPAGKFFGPVTKVTATLLGLSHTFSRDIDVMLQGPQGQTVMLLSDAGSGTDVTNVTITFDDEAPTSVPSSSPVVSGLFKPTNLDSGPDVFPAPAPAGPYGGVLSTFAGLNPAGQWKLYVRDDQGGDIGSIAKGWQIRLYPPTDEDYISTSGTLTFPPGTTSQSIGVQIRGDATVESSQVINVTLTNAVNAIIADPAAGITILDDDGPTPPVGAGKADLAADFGAAGLWTLYNGTTWGSINNLNASQLTAGDLDGNGKADVIADFPGFGVWAYMNDTSWVQLHSLDVSGMATGDLDGNSKSDVLLNFPGAGVWVFANNGTWFQLHTANPSLMITGDLDGNGRAEAILDFPGFGIYAWTNNSYWTLINGHDATTMAAGNMDGIAGDELLISFPTYGLWMLRNNLYWSQLHTLTPTKLAIGDTDNNGHRDAIVDFTGFGVYVYKNNASWVFLHQLDVSLIATADLDGNGKADVLLSFPGFGLYAWMNDTSFAPVHGLNPDAIAPGNFNGN